MRNLIVCCDGTWNRPDQEDGGVPVPTNVVRLRNALAPKDTNGVEQVTYYHTGVGVEHKLSRRIAGGIRGAGLDGIVQSAYKWLCVNYHTGDRIHLFGFSRGAFCVRSLSGMIGRCGLLDLAGLTDDKLWSRVGVSYNRGYRQRADIAEWGSGFAFHESAPGVRTIPIHFLGVWDTVGSLGIPDNMAFLNLFDHPQKYRFHDTALGAHVMHARHAVSLDDDRSSFNPTLWTGTEGRANVKQIWFPGEHGDVGGGRRERGLSDGALKWMIDEAAVTGLAFNKNMYDQIRPDAQDVAHRACVGVYEFLRTQPRSIPFLSGSGTALHESVVTRMKTPPIAQAPYHPTTVLAPGVSIDIPIYAVQRWNETGVYIETDAAYELSASGQWVDKDIKTGPEGDDRGLVWKERFAYFIGSLLGKVELWFRKKTANRHADFWATKRVEDAPWFSLVGVIANGGNPGYDGSPYEHQTFLIGAGCRLGEGGKVAVRGSGYLYCFANDAWDFYANNKGSVTLTITRTA